MTRRAPQIGNKMRRALEESGVPWNLKEGAKHVKVFVAGQLCAVVPRSLRDARRFGGDNALAAVKRAVRAYNGGV